MEEEKAAPKGKPGKAPKWATSSFEQFLDQAQRADDFVQLTIRGISVLRAMPKVVETLNKVSTEKEKEDRKGGLDVESVTRMADLAKREAEEGFPLVFGQGIVTLWSLLEQLIQEFMAAWISNQPELILREPISKLRVYVGEYEQLQPEERMYYIVGMLEREVAAGIRNGVERFESVLKLFRLSGTVPSALRRDMLHFGQVRNLIIHRGGRVDRRFKEACPWVDAKVGEQLKVTSTMVHGFAHAATAYVTILICRVGMHFGVDMAGDLKKHIGAYRTLKAKRKGNTEVET